jgi:hypothetical protein
MMMQEEEQPGRSNLSINTTESIHLSSKILSLQNTYEWENVYLYSTVIFGDNLVKLCTSSQSISKFKDRTSRFYPDPITMHLIGIHPISKRTELELHLAKYMANEDNNGFYTISCIPALDEYLTLMFTTKELSALQTELFQQFNKLCEQSNTGNVKKSDVIERILTTSNATMSYLLANTLLSKLIPDNVNYKWRQDTLHIYQAFIHHHVAKLYNKSDNKTVIDIRFAEVLIAARKWFVFEEKQNGHKIPHKSAQRSILEKLLTEKYGIPERAAGKGLKDSIWKVTINNLDMKNKA